MNYWVEKGCRYQAARKLFNMLYKLKLHSEIEAMHLFMAASLLNKYASDYGEHEADNT